MSICTLHYTQPHIPNILHAHCTPRSRKIVHLPTLHTQPCVWEGRWGQRRRTSRGPPTRTFWVFCVGLCVVSWCVPVVRMSAVWWSRVCMGRGDRVRGGRWCRTRRACTIWHRVACTCACVHIYLFTLTIPCTCEGETAAEVPVLLVTVLLITVLLSVLLSVL